MVDEHDLLNDDEFLLVYLSIGNSCSFIINKDRKRGRDVRTRSHNEMFFNIQLKILPWQRNFLLRKKETSSS